MTSTELRSSLTVSAMAALALWLWPSTASAGGPTEASDFSPSYEQQLLGVEDVSVDTGWIPNGSPVQMRFFADAANSVIIDLPGTAYYDWDTEELRFEGDPLAGFFEYDVGLELVASVKVDVNLVQWQSDLLGPYDWGVEAVDMFTPYLLEGNPDRPAMVSDKSGALDLVSIPLVPDIIVLSGNLDISLYVDLEATLFCNRIEVVGPIGELLEFTQEGQSLWIDPGEGPDDVIMPATAFCQLQTQPTLIIRPHLVVTVLLDEFDIAGIDIPIALPVVDDELQLETIELSFPYWEEPEPADTGGDTGEDTGEDDGETGFDDETGTGGDPSVGGIGDEGCGCMTTDDDGSGALGSTALLVLLAGLGRRRRGQP